MDLSIFLAKALGIWMTISGVALLKNPESIKTIGHELAKEKMPLFISGMFALLIGILLVVSHNVWLLGWPLWITLLGWASLIKGISFLVFPNESKTFAVWYINKVNIRYSSTLYIALGLFLCWKGFA